MISERLIPLRFFEIVLNSVEANIKERACRAAIISSILVASVQADLSIEAPIHATDLAYEDALLIVNETLTTTANPETLS